jgi:two-component system sensor histidine kinase VicK
MHRVLFDKFTEASRLGLRGESSVGLGMSIIKNIVELHDGRIWFTSEVNKGTTFFIELPK